MSKSLDAIAAQHKALEGPVGPTLEGGDPREQTRQQGLQLVLPSAVA